MNAGARIGWQVSDGCDSNTLMRASLLSCSIHLQAARTSRFALLRLAQASVPLVSCSTGPHTPVCVIETQTLARGMPGHASHSSGELHGACVLHSLVRHAPLRKGL